MRLTPEVTPRSGHYSIRPLRRRFSQQPCAGHEIWHDGVMTGGEPAESSRDDSPDSNDSNDMTNDDVGAPGPPATSEPSLVEAVEPVQEPRATPDQHDPTGFDHDEFDPDEFDPNEPWLPVGAEPTTPIAEEQVPVRSPRAVPTANVYRSTEERNRSVYRRANPWYRRLARGVIAASLLAALGLGVYLGARELQDYLGRDRLPAAGAEVPAIRESSFLVNSTGAFAPLQGTLTVDFQTGAFEFVGTAGSPNATDNLTSPDGGTVYALTTAGRWQQLGDDQAVVTSIKRTIAALSDDTTADAILTNRLRRGYVDLVRQVEEGEGDQARTRYDVDLRLAQFADDFPLQWQDFQTNAIPGIQVASRAFASFWIDPDDVLVRVVDDRTGWRWDRLEYSTNAFTAFAPAAAQIDAVVPASDVATIACRIEALDLDWATALPTCDEAAAIGRELTVSVGLADDAASPATELVFANVCTSLQGTEPRTYDDPDELKLAQLLIDTNVCPGDINLLQPVGG
jgi:hypothetical protein